MGSYATTSSISIRLPSFLNGNTTTSDAETTNTFSEYIGKGEAMFNSAVSKRYALPFTTVPPMAREISFDIAAYYTILAFSTRDWPNRNETLDDMKQAFKDLDRISSGEIRLALTDGSLVPPRSSAVMLTNRESEGAIFDVDEPTEWQVDQNRLDDLEGSRD